MVAPLVMAGIAMLPSLLSAMKGASGSSAPTSGYSKDSRDALRRQTAYQEASVNPQHPWAQALSGQIKQMLEQQAAKGIQEDMLLRRRAIAAGNTTAGIDPSRRDEARSNALVQAFQKSGSQAQMAAAEQLSRAGQMAQGQTAGYMGLAEQDMLTKNTNQQNQQAGMSGIASILPGLMNLFGGMGGGGSSYGGTGQGMMLRDVKTGMLGGGV